jgi:hypothetical protein
MNQVSRAEAIEMMRTVDGPFSAKVLGLNCSTKQTAVSREKMVRSAIFHEWNEFSARDLRSFAPKPKVVDNPCVNCGGTGKLSHYAHVESGVCFKCNGTGKGRKG